MKDDPQYLDESLGFIIYRTGLAIKSALQRFFRENGHGITGEQWVLMRHLWQQEGLTQKEIGEKTAKDKPNITRMLDALEKKGVIFRWSDPQDRRKYRIYLTPAGKELYQRLAPLAQNLRQRVTQNLTQPEIDLLTDTLKKIHQNIG